MRTGNRTDPLIGPQRLLIERVANSFGSRDLPPCRFPRSQLLVTWLC
uniref:Uncharacterized protein n=1 Tax=Utricularia reniformis TaxID=192314 RepID=A0A1Y0B3Z5_9LAMI|nr:hypothetical protein AEK19_MT1958 [Utricularia reniformis]ART32120.1 hypothetical protein AEK19_MT1958 [Utricularia reniformis]